jgi:hypothetical protein
MKSYYIRTISFCCRVDVNDKGVIVNGAPIIKRFIGKKFTDLTHAFRYQNLRWSELNDPKN